MNQSHIQSVSKFYVQTLGVTYKSAWYRALFLIRFGTGPVLLYSTGLGWTESGLQTLRLEIAFDKILVILYICSIYFSLLNYRIIFIEVQNFDFLTILSLFSKLHYF